MLADGRHRVISYHDTWISIDPVQGCPYQCAYCVLRYGGTTGTAPRQTTSPSECVRQLLEYPFFIRSKTPIAIGNETDMLHPKNVDYLVSLLTEIKSAEIKNTISLITKAPLTDKTLARIREVVGNQVVFFLSYSGLGSRFEPNFTDEQLQQNFSLVKRNGFPLVHYWRPLLPVNTTIDAIQRMLNFVSTVADATVFVGLKLHPGLTEIITQNGVVDVPVELREKYGEWLPAETIPRIYDAARQICPHYRLYRHTSCAIASVFGKPNHTATVFRDDVCPPSHCPQVQRDICQAARRIPSLVEVEKVVLSLGRELNIELEPDRVVIREEVSQEEFTFLLHNLNCPLEVKAVHMNNLYHGDIFKGQKTNV